MSGLPPQRASSRSFALAVGAIIVVVAVVVLVVRAGSDASHAGPPGPATSSIDIVSSPIGASVVRADDGRVLGITPFTATLPKGEHELPVLVKHEGYAPRRVTVPLFAETGRVDVTLTALGADGAAVD